MTEPARKSCVFCGSTATLTGEHVLPAWLARIGLSEEPLAHAAGRLNRSLDEQGVSPPFRRTVRDVCATCNHGWLSRLEVVAKEALSDFVLGRPGAIKAELAGTIATWFHKTVLVSMLTTPDAAAARGDNPFGRDFRGLYELHQTLAPLPQTTVWLGRYVGDRLTSAWLTPMTVDVASLPTAELPGAYVMTLVLGELLVHGVRFTTPMLAFEVLPTRRFAQLWPASGPVAWPRAEPVTDADFMRLAKGLDLRASDGRFALSPWRPATDLPASNQVGPFVRLPTICGRHFALYPTILVSEAVNGTFYAFVVSCPCPKRYLIVTEADGAHCKWASSGSDPKADELARREYDRLAGEEVEIEGPAGTFACKRLDAAASSK